MTHEENKALLDRYQARFDAERREAQEGLDNIAAGWRFSVSQGAGPLRDNTEERKAEWERIIKQCDELMEAYRRWYS